MQPLWISQPSQWPGPSHPRHPIYRIACVLGSVSKPACSRWKCGRSLYSQGYVFYLSVHHQCVSSQVSQARHSTAHQPAHPPVTHPLPARVDRYIQQQPASLTSSHFISSPRLTDRQDSQVFT
mmetsp:Transcript_24660/g.71187  ORF Transcript_24660/g.71187 Transcript_24660/m.71187 type:complete len:123 (-) Transcript_24660:766-1134(-)